MRRHFVSLAVIVLFGSAVWADEPWWQWRGPQRNDISPAKGLLEKWDGAPPLVWKIEDLGFGYSSPVVRQGIVCATAERGPRSFVVAIDDKTGKELWATDIDAAKHVRKNFEAWPGPYSTPAIDGERIYALSDGGILVCLETTTGKLVWKKDFQADFRACISKEYHGYGESPLVDGDKIICTPGSPEAGIVSLDKKTGQEIWRCAVAFSDPKGGKDVKSRGASYASMVISHAAGIKQYVQLMHEGLVGVDAQTGKQLWSYRLGRVKENLTTPVIRSDFVFCNNRSGCVLLKLHKQKHAVAVEKIYAQANSDFFSSVELSLFMGDCALIGDHLYLIQASSMLCAEFLTGKRVWRKVFSDAQIEGRMAFADGHFYFPSGQGDVLMVNATPQGCAIKGRFDFPLDKRIRHAPKRQSYSQPAISNGRLYVRESNLLYCYDLKKK